MPDRTYPYKSLTFHDGVAQRCARTIRFSLAFHLKDMNHRFITNWFQCSFVGLSLATYAACPQYILAQDSKTELPRSSHRRQAPLSTLPIVLGTTLWGPNDHTALLDDSNPEAANGSSSGSLSESFTPQSDPQNSNVPAPALENSASITGIVLDGSGAVVVGAQVSLADRNASQQRTLVSGANGEFTFARLPAGTYLVLINAKGLEPFKSGEILVAAQQTYDMPTIVMSIATKSTEVNVDTHTTEVIADEQVKAEEKQRILGILPNFYTSYLPNAVPLNTKQKYSLAFRDAFDPIRFVGSAVTAGVEQSNNSYAGYGQGAAGYGKRFAAAYGNGLTSNILSHAVFPSLFHQDPRYFYQGSGTTKSRLMHAISFAVVTRNDSGGLIPNYSYLLGDIGSGALSNLYYPHANRGAGLVFTNAAIGIAGRAGGTIIREFFLKRITTNVPGNGTP